jgi:DNA polymerase-3 subunit delta'
MALRDIIGHEGVINILRGYIRKDRLPHALLFAGDEGIGKRLTAINLAKTLNCMRVAHQGIDCCDECASCRKIEMLRHPDVFLIRPEGPGGEIKISPIRELQESLSYKPFEGRWKVAIIDDAEALNPSSANAFLATLEEPPDRTVIILITPRPDMLLETIRSRCQRLNFSPLPLNSLLGLLSERLKGLDQERLRLLCELSGGRFGQAMDEDLLGQRDRMFDMFLEVLDAPSKDLWRDKKDMEAWFDWCELWLRDMAVLQATGDKALLINRDRVAEMERLCRGLVLKDILMLARILYNIKRLLRFNLNRPITLYYINLLFRRMKEGSFVTGGMDVRGH